MSKQDNLCNADGTKEIKKTSKTHIEDIVYFQLNPLETELGNSKSTSKVGAHIESATEKITNENLGTPQILNEVPNVNEDTEDVIKNSSIKINEGTPEHDKIIHEIEETNAEDAQDKGNKERHTIQFKEYDKMSLENLTIELEKLVKKEKIQAIKTHVDAINNAFKTKFHALLEQKKQEFLLDGGNEIDFYYSTPIQKRFKNSYREYKNKVHEHHKNLEKNLKQNLVDKLEIIEELKGLINVEENINTTYKHFKALQERWRNTGPIPRDRYNNAWNSYHHHVEIFYDFLHLNRDLRDLDFKYNLDKKLKIIERTEELAKNNDVISAFRELQELHKMWKEELGPVGKEHREDIWERFKTSTRIINDKRQAYYQEIDKVYNKNLEKKLEIITSIEAITAKDINSHTAWRKEIKEIELLREAFFNAGKVPIKTNKATWGKFKDAVRIFNKKKNAFYKGLKKEQFQNLHKKLELIQIAEDNKDHEDIVTTTALMKKIQSDWKKIGHVPRKDSDKIWNQFKAACNHFFDRLHTTKNQAKKEELDAFKKKYDVLETLKTIHLSGDKANDLPVINKYIAQWKNLGGVPNDKRYIERKFNNVLDGLLSNLKMDKNEVELLKFDNKLKDLSHDYNSQNLDNEHSFIRKKIDDLKGQINQLENNLQFFTNVNDDNPLVNEVHNNISKHKESLNLWKTKLSKIKKLY